MEEFIDSLLKDIKNKLKLEGYKRVFEEERELKSTDLKERQAAEEFTRGFLIDKILFDFLKVDLVARDRTFSGYKGDRRVDYDIRFGILRILIEAKPINAELKIKSRDSAVNQIKGIFTLAEVKENYDFGIATNGLKWIFINKKGKIIDELDLLEDTNKIKNYIIGEEEVAQRKLEDISKKFYEEYNDLLHGVKRISKDDCLVESISYVENEEDREEIAQIIIDRLIFIKFLQSKGIIKENVLDFLFKLEDHDLNLKLNQLFFEVMSTKEKDRSSVDPHFSHIPYLNGSLFEKLEVEKRNSNYKVRARILHRIIEFLNKFRFVHHESLDNNGDFIDPEILGYIFERAMTATDRKGTGAYYTSKYVTRYIAENTIYPTILNKANRLLEKKEGYKKGDLLKNIDQLFILPPTTLQEIWNKTILTVTICDNACGSGAFLLAMANVLYELNKRIRDKLSLSKTTDVALKKLILKAIYGIDINPRGIEIARLRMWLWLVESYKPEHVEPLPNIEYNLSVGNSLIGKIDIEKFGTTLVTLEDFGDHEETVKVLLKKFLSLKREYQRISGDEARKIKDEIEIIRKRIDGKLNLELFRRVNKEKINFDRGEFLRSKPFHWGFELYEIFNLNKKSEDRGFDIIVGNPPYVDIKGMDPKMVKYLFYQFNTTENRINLYSSFVERSLELLREGGCFGYIIPNSILFNDSYKKIRRLLLEKSNLTSIVRLPDNVFKDAKVETIILIFQKSPAIKKKTKLLIYDRDDYITSIDTRKCKEYHKINQSVWSEDQKSIFNIYSSEEIQNILRKIENNTQKMIEICDFSLGLTPYDKYKGHTKEQIKNKAFHSDHKKSESFKKLLSGEDIIRYGLFWNEKNWINYGPWLGAPREQRFFTRPRILIRQIVTGDPPRIFATYTDKEFYNTQIAFNFL